MKKMAVLLAFMLSVGVLAGCGKSKDSKSDKLIMATEAGFAPYEYLSNNEVVGVDVDIAKEIAKELDKELEIQNTNFDGALLSVQQGKVDFVAAGISITPEREEVMDFSIPYATSKQVVVVKKGSDVIKTPDDINSKTRVGAQLGTVGQYYAEDDIDCEVKTYTKYAQAVTDLNNDKIDCIIMDELPAKELVKANNNIEILEKELFTDEYAIAVQKGNKELLDKINKVIERLKSEGKIDEFTLKHTGN